MTRFSSYRDFDWTLLSFVLLMSIFSVVEIYSATLHTKFHGFHTRQIEFLALGIPLMFVMSMIDYHKLLDIAHWAYGISIVSLIAVLVVGHKVLGARRWIAFPGGIHFQPSEWIKLVLIIVSARYFWGLANKDELDWTDIGKAFAMVGGPMLLVLKQPDLADVSAGTARRPLSWRPGMAARADTCRRLRGGHRRRVEERQSSQAIPEGAAHQLPAS